MRNLVFMLWMLLYLQFTSIIHLLNKLYLPGVFSDHIFGLSALIEFIIYIIVAILLYEKKER